VVSFESRLKSLEVLIPILYLKGISTGDFEEALIALLGKDAISSCGGRVSAVAAVCLGPLTPTL
jgi:hypothetical protein